MMEKIIILDFGSQYTQLIARRVRELDVYSEIQPYHEAVNLDASVKAVILSGSPMSVSQLDKDIDWDSFLGAVPVLGVCFGAQYLAKYFGGNVQKSSKREYGKASLSEFNKDHILFQGVSPNSQVWMSHADTIIDLPDDFEAIARTKETPVAAFTVKNRFEHAVFGIQFHPEVTHTLEGATILKNFVYEVAKCKPSWTPDSFVETTIQRLKDQVGDSHVLMGLSGGVDSTVCATLLHRAIGDRLHSFFIDNGLLRKNEFEEVLAQYKRMGLNVTGINAKNEFLSELKGISDPEQKRKTIGRVFIEVFQREAEKLDNVDWLGQGTIYPDVIESVSVKGPSATIKSHHNVGGLPKTLNLKLVEPLRLLFKDEVRRVGRALEIPGDILGHHPFPGPGLAIRLIGAIDEDRIETLQNADHIFIEGLKKSGYYNKVWQAGAILLPVKTVGVMGDERTYEWTCALRSVDSVDGMTAEWSKLSHEVLAEISTQIINQVKGINRVVYDISTKPPATIEWE